MNIDKQLDKIEAIWMQAENRVISDIARRISQYGEITSTADYQINRLMDTGKSSEQIEKILLEATKKTMPEMWELYDKVADWQYVRCKEIYEQINDKAIPPEENEWIQQVNEAIKTQTKGMIENLSRSYGFSVWINGHKVFTPFSRYYQQYIDDSIFDVVSGNMDYGTAMRRAVKQMTDSGLRTVDYASGRSNRTPVAVRRAVLTGVNQLTAQINEHNAKLLKTDKYEVDWHAGARPTHAVWQGRVYSHDDLVRVCGLGDVAGLCGANCSHTYYPFVEGVSVRAYSDEFLDKMAKEEEKGVTYNGKHFTVYEAKQTSRKMETAMRAQRLLITGMKSARAGEDLILDEQIKYKTQLREYEDFCKKTGQREQRERIYMDGLGRVTQ